MKWPLSFLVGCCKVLLAVGKKDFCLEGRKLRLPLDNCSLCKSKHIKTVVDRKELSVWGNSPGTVLPFTLGRYGKQWGWLRGRILLFCPFQLLHYYAFSPLVFLVISAWQDFSFNITPLPSYIIFKEAWVLKQSASFYNVGDMQWQWLLASLQLLPVERALSVQEMEWSFDLLNKLLSH